jgi:hypothetical protein
VISVELSRARTIQEPKVSPESTLRDDVKLEAGVAGKV